MFPHFVLLFFPHYLNSVLSTMDAAGRKSKNIIEGVYFINHGEYLENHTSRPQR